jgi:receptor protein-tyrosine kinase
MSQNTGHLVERLAERLRGVGGLAAPDMAPERDIRRVIGREGALRRPFQVDPSNQPRSDDDAERDPRPRGRARPAPDGRGAAEEEGDTYDPFSDSYTRDTSHSDAPSGRSVPMRSGAADSADESEGLSNSHEVVDASRSPPVLADGTTALAVPETPRAPPLDMAALERAGLVVGHKVRTRISEEFRITVGHMLRSMHANYSPGRGAANAIMITSSRPGEGKSFSSLNLAGSIAQHAQREVLLVDVDAKQRSITHELGLSDRVGLLDLSSNSALRIEDVIIRTALPHLSLLTIGSGQTTGASAATRPITALVERIARRFPNSVVLLDAPPCLSTSDPSTLAPFVGQIVMIVEAERTQRNEVIAALDLLKACPSVTLMLNKIRLTTSYTFGAYHYFGTYS